MQAAPTNKPDTTAPNQAAIRRNRVLGIAATICHLLIIAATIYSVGLFFSAGGVGNMALYGGVRSLRFFTVDSNILVAASSLAVLPFCIRKACGSTTGTPTWVRLLGYVGSVAVGVTLFTVLLFLGPTMGYGFLFTGVNLYLHLTTPLLALLSYIIFEADEPLPFRTTALGVLPVALYAIVYLTEVVLIGEANGGWPDFYGFNVNGMWPVSAVAMFAATYVLSVLVWKLQTVAVGTPTQR